MDFLRRGFHLIIMLGGRGDGIKVLADLKKGEGRFSIDMQVLTDLERVLVRDLAIPNYRVSPTGRVREGQALALRWSGGFGLWRAGTTAWGCIEAVRDGAISTYRFWVCARKSS